jgi:hypothetical protein
MGFNIDIYRDYLKSAGFDGKSGLFTVRRFPNGKYCFATRQWLGDNGRIDSHPLLGKRFERVEDGVVFLVDSVCIHWYSGFYYHATLRDDSGSHTTAYIGNINCDNSIILEGLSEFSDNYRIVE